MEEQKEIQEQGSSDVQQPIEPAPQPPYARPSINGWKVTALVVLCAFILTQATGYTVHGLWMEMHAPPTPEELQAMLEEAVMVDEVVLPVQWGDLGMQLVNAGVIDLAKWNAVYDRRGGASEGAMALLTDSQNGAITMTQHNANELLNILWAFGLANKNVILDEGPMQDHDTSRFASTGGWSLGAEHPMNYYSALAMVELTPEQQAMVERVAKGIHRPCCGNDTYFPDCNHGMAMLGLLQLMAANGLSEAEMYDVALQVNSYWFPDTYLTLAKYFHSRGVDWTDVDAAEVLGSAYSSAAGYRQIQAEVEPVQSRGGQGCGV